MTDTAIVPRSEGGGIREAWLGLKAAEPHIRARDAAERLGVSEAELVAARLGDGVRRLQPRWADLLTALPSLGEVMVLTRNDYAAHEKTGRFGNVSVNGHVALVLNQDIDLRLFLGRWAHVFAVEEETRSGFRSSLHIFGADGRAIHKIYVTDRTDRGAFDALVAELLDPEAGSMLDIQAEEKEAANRPDSLVDVARLHAEWDALKDTHDFVFLLKRLAVGRAQALRLAGKERATAVPAETFRNALVGAAERNVPVMVFVGNPGAIQIHSGPVRTLKALGPWFNVLDPGFNLHLMETGIATAWIVRKPTVDGTVTSIEIYDSAGRPIAQMFEQRKPGVPEREDWRALAESLAGAPA
jgi:putative hemin transport protein